MIVDRTGELGDTYSDKGSADKRMPIISKVTMIIWVKPPLVPVTLITYVPGGVLASAVILMIPRELEPVETYSSAGENSTTARW